MRALGSCLAFADSPSGTLSCRRKLSLGPRHCAACCTNGMLHYTWAISVDTCYLSRDIQLLSAQMRVPQMHAHQDCTARDDRQLATVTANETRQRLMFIDWIIVEVVAQRAW